MHRDLGPAPPHPPAIQPPRGRPGEGPMDFAVSSRVPRRGADAARVGSKSILKGRHEGQRRALDWADVCPQGMRTMTKPLVCAGQRASQFPLRPYTYRPDRDFSFIEINQRLRQLHPGIVDEVVRSLEQHGGAVTRDVDTDLLSVNSMLSVSIVIARCHTTPSDALRWTSVREVGIVEPLSEVEERPAEAIGFSGSASCSLAVVINSASHPTVDVSCRHEKTEAFVFCSLCGDVL